MMNCGIRRECGQWGEDNFSCVTQGQDWKLEERQEWRGRSSISPPVSFSD